MSNPFITSATSALDSGNRSLWFRIMTEGKIVRKLIKTAIDAGYVVSVNDGEEWVVKRSSKVAECVNACYSTDEEIIKIRLADGSHFVSVFCVYGNDGYDVLSDWGYTHENEKAVDAFMAPIAAYAETFDV